jgi:hypothetical protein
VLGLLTAVGTAASLGTGEVHGFTIVIAVACAALATGLAACANLIQKKILRRKPPLTES